MSNLVIEQLPRAMRWVVPELESLTLPKEPLATCEACPLLPGPDDEMPPIRIVFAPETRCCTYHPNMPNFMVGRVLADGGRGAELMRARIRAGEAVDEVLVGQPERFQETYEEMGLDGFGRRRDMRCPFYVEAQLTCGVWPHRNGVCRTWFCRYQRGFRGRHLWNRLRDVLNITERRLAYWLASEGEPPEAPVTPAEWESWYLWCAERLDLARPDELRGIRDEELLMALRELLKAAADYERPMPDVLRPSVRDIETIDDDRVRLVGYSHLDDKVLPRSVFSLLALLDGGKTWQDCLEEASSRLEPELASEKAVRELYRVGIIGMMEWMWEDEDELPGAD